MTTRSGGRLQRRDLHELLDAVFTVCLLDKSLSTHALESAVSEARSRARRKVARMKLHRESKVDADLLGLVIYRWQRLPKYLDDDGNSIPLPARGRGMSIETLFKEVKRADYFSAGIKHLIKTKRIFRTRNHRYVPSEQTVLVRTLTPEIVEYMTHTINRLVATVLYNTSIKGARPMRLVERMASVSDLPKKQVRAFKKFALEQGAGLVHALNDWLESRRDGGSARVVNSKKHLTAGVHVFGFVEK